MRRDDLIDRLNQALHLESRSLIAYLIAESEPLTKERGQKEFASVFEKIRVAEEGQVEGLVHLIDELGGIPEPGSFDMKGAYYNYLSPDYVLRVLKERLSSEAADLDSIAAQLADEPSAQSIVKSFADRKREHMALLATVKLPERKAVMAAKPKAAGAAPAAAKKPAAPAPSPAAGSGSAPAKSAGPAS